MTVAAHSGSEMNAPGLGKLQVGHGMFDPLTGELRLDGRSVRLRPRTAGFLAHLIQHDDRVVGKNELMEAVWPDSVVTEDSIVQCVKEIRLALGPSAHEWIRTVPRQGYAFVGNRDEPPPAGAPLSRRHLRLLAAGAVLVLAAACLLVWSLWPAAPSVRAATIVALPIANATGDAAHERTATELTEAITDVLGRSRFTVVAPSTALMFKDKPVDVHAVGTRLGVRYILQGTLRMGEAGPVLRLRLADVASSAQLWQQDFQVSPGFPELRADVKGGILSALGEQVVLAEARRSGLPDAWKAAEMVARANEVLRSPASDEEKARQVRQLLEVAVRLNDDLGVAWVLLAVANAWDVRYADDRDKRLLRAGQAVERARKLLPNNDSVIAVQSLVYLEQGRVSEALREADRALELNPGNADAMVRRARALIVQGRSDEALAQIDKAMRTSPRDPTLATMHGTAGVAQLHLGNVEAAIEALSAAAKVAPGSASVHLYLAAALGAAGRTAEARAAMAQFRQLRPGFTLTRLRATELSQEPALVLQRQRIYDGLQRAGMPA
jgi:DNA-binding winged helix-turn-helix (wHTH) protein/TolB-like protein/Flp pilus assembly protein TadD